VLCSAGLFVPFVQFVSPLLTMAKAKFKDSCVQVLVRDTNVDQALKALKKKMQREGIFREMKLRGHYEKPSEKRAAKRRSRTSRPQAGPQKTAA
jgi:small subunit ribosomal protein S21